MGWNAWLHANRVCAVPKRCVQCAGAPLAPLFAFSDPCLQLIVMAKWTLLLLVLVPMVLATSPSQECIDLAQPPWSYPSTPPA